jgi:hypothetical protein
MKNKMGLRVPIKVRRSPPTLNSYIELVTEFNKQIIKHKENYNGTRD